MTRSNSAIAAISMFAVSLSACTSGGAARVEPAHVMLYDKARNCEVDRPDPAGIGPRKSGSARPGAIALDCFRFPSSNPGKEFAYELALKSDLDRNRLAFVLLSQADTICIVEKSLMLERQAEVNGWLSIATTGLSVASTIVTGNQASNILSGGAAFTSGSRDHVNTHVYRNQIIQTVTTAIDTKRGEALADILTNLKKKKEEYSIDAAIRDVNAYVSGASQSARDRIHDTSMTLPVTNTSHKTPIGGSASRRGGGGLVR